jgi:hypothetical protein
MNSAASRRALQVVVAVLGLIPLATGICAFVLGPEAMPGGVPVSPSIQNEYRFLSSFWFAFGVLIYTIVPGIERQTRRVRFLALFIFIGGLGRLWAVLAYGRPQGYYLAAMALELVGIPLLVWWQAAIAVPAVPAVSVPQGETL